MTRNYLNTILHEYFQLRKPDCINVYTPLKIIWSVLKQMKRHGRLDHYFCVCVCAAMHESVYVCFFQMPANQAAAATVLVVKWVDA